MGMLHLVPVMLLGAVGVWLIWPVIVDPARRALDAARQEKADSSDTLADDLFRAWRAEGGKTGLIEPLRRS